MDSVEELQPLGSLETSVDFVWMCTGRTIMMCRGGCDRHNLFQAGMGIPITLMCLRNGGMGVGHPTDCGFHLHASSHLKFQHVWRSMPCGRAKNCDVISCQVRGVAKGWQRTPQGAIETFHPLEKEGGHMQT